MNWRPAMRIVSPMIACGSVTSSSGSTSAPSTATRWRPLVVAGGEHRPLADGESAHVEEVGRRAGDLNVRVLVLPHDLEVAVLLRRDADDVHRARLDRLDVVVGELGRRASCRSRLACTRCGLICSVVVPSRAMRSFTASCRAVAERDHRDDGRDTDDDAEHREERPQRVRAQRRERGANDFANQHGRCGATNDAVGGRSKGIEEGGCGGS